MNANEYLDAVRRDNPDFSESDALRAALEDARISDDRSAVAALERMVDTYGVARALGQVG